MRLWLGVRDIEPVWENRCVEEMRGYKEQAVVRSVGKERVVFAEMRRKEETREASANGLVPEEAYVKRRRGRPGRH